MFHSCLEQDLAQEYLLNVVMDGPPSERGAIRVAMGQMWKWRPEFTQPGCGGAGIHILAAWF